MTLFDDGTKSREIRSVVFAERTKASPSRAAWLVPPAPTPTPPPAVAEPLLDGALPVDLVPQPSASDSLPAPEPSNVEPVLPQAIAEERAKLDAARLELVGLERSLQARKEATDALLGRLEAALHDLEATRTTMLEASERQLVELAFVIARRVVAREIATDPATMLELAREGITALTERDAVTVRVGAPLDEQALSTFFERTRSKAKHFQVERDESLSPGQCVVETDLGRVDESVDVRLSNLFEHILPDAGPKA
jgi:flagellar assembly protein FliH